MKWCYLSLGLWLAGSLGAADKKEPDYAKVPRLPDVAAPGQEAVQKSIDRGVYFLVGNQNQDGSWGRRVTPRA